MVGGIVLFDGVCNFCSGSVQFIIKRDIGGFYKFSSLQSAAGQKLIKSYNIPKDMDSFIVIENKTYYTKSTAALRVSKHLKGFWKFLYLFIIVPSPIRNLVYDFVAKKRYRWFGKSNECMIPSPEIRDRFI